MFLIDDATSMAPHWNDVIKVVEVLSYIVKEADPDGLDLYFTVSTKTLRHRKKTTSLDNMVKERTGQLKGLTDMNLKLCAILDQYQQEHMTHTGIFTLKKPKPILPLNLYILTDGVWETVCHAEGPIKNQVNKMVEHNRNRSHVGIQFISFGNDPVGIQRMDYLDSGLDLEL